MTVLDLSESWKKNPALPPHQPLGCRATVTWREDKMVEGILLTEPTEPTSSDALVTFVASSFLPAKDLLIERVSGSVVGIRQLGSGEVAVGLCPALLIHPPRARSRF